MSHSLRDEVDEELRHKMVQYFGMPGQDLMEFFSFKKDLGIDIAPYMEAKLLSLVKNKNLKISKVIHMESYKLMNGVPNGNRSMNGNGSQTENRSMKRKSWNPSVAA